jgi:hypothetical protein
MSSLIQVCIDNIISIAADGFFLRRTERACTFHYKFVHYDISVIPGAIQIFSITIHDRYGNNADRIRQLVSVLKCFALTVTIFCL